MTDFIEVYDNALSSDVCKTVIDYMNILPRRRVTKEGLKDAYYTTDTLLNEPSPHTISLVNALHGCVSKYVEKHHQLKRTALGLLILIIVFRNMILIWDIINHMQRILDWVLYQYKEC